MTKERALELIKNDYEEELEDSEHSFDNEVKEAHFEETEDGIHVRVEWKHKITTPTGQTLNETEYLVTNDEDVLELPA